MIIILLDNMFGIFVLPVKTDDKAYPYKKDPKKPLNLSGQLHPPKGGCLTLPR